jgi:hypothetical protein
MNKTPGLEAMRDKFRQENRLAAFLRSIWRAFAQYSGDPNKISCTENS